MKQIGVRQIIRGVLPDMDDLLARQKIGALPNAERPRRIVEVHLHDGFQRPAIWQVATLNHIPGNHGIDMSLQYIRPKCLGEILHRGHPANDKILLHCILQPALGITANKRRNLPASP